MADNETQENSFPDRFLDFAINRMQCRTSPGEYIVHPEDYPLLPKLLSQKSEVVKPSPFLTHSAGYELAVMGVPVRCSADIQKGSVGFHEAESLNSSECSSSGKKVLRIVDLFSPF